MRKTAPTFRPNMKLSHLVYQGGRSQHYDISDNAHAGQADSKIPKDGRTITDVSRDNDGDRPPHRSA